MAKTIKTWGEIKKNILSKEDKVFNAAIKYLEKNGKGEFLKPLVELLNSLSDKRKEAIFSFLSKLKHKGSEIIMMEIIKDKKHKKHQDRLLNSLWNSSLDYTLFFSDFVEIACSGEYMTALECITILENLNGPLLVLPTDPADMIFCFSFRI